MNKFVERSKDLKRLSLRTIQFYKWAVDIRDSRIRQPTRVSEYLRSLIILTLTQTFLLLGLPLPLVECGSPTGLRSCVT